MRDRIILLLVVLAAACLTRAAAAQDPSDSATYMALTRTPLAALPAALDVGITGQRARGVSFRARYGIMSYDTHEYIHDFGLGLDFPVGRSTVGLTAGYHWNRCNGTCSSHFMASAGLSRNLLEASLGAGEHAAGLGVGLQTQLGFARPGDTTLVAGKIALPVALVPSSGTLRFVPYVSPGLGLGLARQNGSTEAGLLFVFDAGLGVMTAGGFSASLGVSRAFLKGGNWLVGLDLAVGAWR